MAVAVAVFFASAAADCAPCPVADSVSVSLVAPDDIVAVAVAVELLVVSTVAVDVATPFTDEVE